MIVLLVNELIRNLVKSTVRDNLCFHKMMMEKSDFDSEAELCLESGDDWFGNDNNDSC